jgi:hypothetical protein
MVTVEVKLSREAFWSAVKDAQTFDDLVSILNNYRRFHGNRVFQMLFIKCMHFAENGFVLNEEIALWRRILKDPWPR